MDVLKKESLELLRSRIDLVEALEPHIDLKRAGASYKACCPFHEEKTPSFIVKRGDSHYHCFGCGAHGDAIAFFMNHLKMSFVEAVEHLAERFQILLEREEVSGGEPRLNKKVLKEAMEKASEFYHYCLLHTKEGHRALQYLYDRGLNLDFVRTFRIGWAPDEIDLLMRFLRKERVSDEISEMVGLIRITQSGRKRDFFSDRITFPVLDKMGAVIGFSARKIREETFGGKYINTSETPLFKKSHILFGLSQSRRLIAKERRVIVVEGQIDALRLIHEGIDFVVAGQGTAFGEGHVSELLALGVNHAYLALDADVAGKAAAVKIGNLFQKKCVEVSIVPIPEGFDPDTLLQEVGSQGFLHLLEKSQTYLSFLVSYHSSQIDMSSPSGKNELVKALSAQIRAWDEPVMIHESLRKLAELLRMPENLIGVDEVVVPNLYVKREEAVSVHRLDPDKVIESDLVRWLFLAGESHPEILERIEQNISKEDFKNSLCRKLFEIYFQFVLEEKPCDLLSIGIQLEDGEEGAFLSELFQKKVNLQRVEEGVNESIQKLLTRKWMEKREGIKAKIHEGSLPDDALLELARAFDEMKKNPPQILLSSSKE